MDSLFTLLMLLSVLALCVGLIRPQVFQKFLGNNSNRKRIGIIFGTASIIFFILVGISSPSKPKVASENKAAEPATTVPVTPKTEEKMLNDKLKEVISTTKGVSTKISYKNLQEEKAGPHRPKNTTEITVGVDVGSFWNKAALLRDTGKLSSQIFQIIFTSKSDAYDVFVWYYAKTKDKYGNEHESTVLTYGLDKATYEKINWSGFDTTKLCDFLTNEARATNNQAEGIPECRVLANIE